MDRVDALVSEVSDLFRERLVFFAMRRLTNRNDAEDVAQETIARTIEALRTDRVRNTDALPGFVFQTARHICLHRFRSSGREQAAMARIAPTEEHDTSSADALTELIDAERRQAVQRALKRLPEADRLLLRLVYDEDRTPGEVAGQLGLNSGTIRVRKHRALQRLARLLGAAGGETFAIDRELH
jgi:RNA polymerase sigma factor (sigma-70 family)